MAVPSSVTVSKAASAQNGLLKVTVNRRLLADSTVEAVGIVTVGGESLGSLTSMQSTSLSMMVPTAVRSARTAPLGDVS